jgi:mono/diheme cytochrome c family protein
MFANSLRLGALIWGVSGALTLGWAAGDAVERGRYLVEEVAKCYDCHTPRTENGEMDRTRWLKGAVLHFQPIQPIPGWHKTAPDLTPAGRLFQKWGEENLFKYLTTGLNPAGKPAGPPMPTYKLAPEDARAIIEYLKSLK